MIYVVDASVAVKWYVPESFEQNADRVLASGFELHAPELILPEFANIIWKKIRRGEISEAEGKRMLSAIVSVNWSLHSHQSVVRSAFTGAVETGQTVYDWTYLALAVALSCEFVTADEKFYRAIEQTKLRKNIKWIGDV